MNSINPSGSRVEISAKDSLKDILALKGDTRLQVLQFKEPLPRSFFPALNQEFFSVRPDVELRAYGSYSKICDLSFLKEMTNVERFRADCLQRATGLENLAALERQTLLGIGVFELDNFDFLNVVSTSLENLTLSQTRSRKPSLTNLNRFTQLRELSLGCHSKGIEALTGHPQLERLFMTSLKPDARAILRTLPNLRDLELALGRMKDLSALQGLDRLQKLTIWWISLLSNLDDLISLKGLKKLSFEKQSHVVSLPSFRELMQLESVRLIEMKALSDISGLAHAPALKELRHTSSALKPADYIPILKIKTLKRASVYFRTKAADKEFDKLCLDHGLPTPTHYH